MRIFGKHIFRSIKANPRQPVLITLIVCLSVAVMIMSVALPINIYRNEQASLLVDEYTADLEIGLKADSEQRLVFENEVLSVLGDRGRVMGEFALTGFLTAESGAKRRQVNIGAFDLQRIDGFYGLQYVKRGKVTNTNLKTVAIVSESFADECGLSLGDTFLVNVLGDELSYTVEAIVKDSGIMKRDSVLVDIGSVRAALNKRSPVIASLPSDFTPFTKVHVKLADGVSAETIKSELEALEDFSNKKIDLPADRVKANYMTTLLTVTVVTPALLLVLVAVMMTVSTFDLLAKKRSDDLALFKSVGASVGQIGFVIYLEAWIYATVGGVLGSLLSIPAMRGVNNLYDFTFVRMSFGIDDVLVGVGSAFVFTTLCSYLHIRRQSKKSLNDGLKSTNLYTNEGLLGKIVLFGAPVVILGCVTALLPVRLRFLGGFAWLFAVVTFIYTIFPHVVSVLSGAISHLLSKSQRGAGSFILASKSCSNSYPLCHAGRITTVLVTVFMSLAFILSAAEGQMISYFSLPEFDYVGVMVDDLTKERVSKLDGVIATGEASMTANVIFESGKAATGVSLKGDADLLLEGDTLPEKMPEGNSVALSRGLVRMLDIELGDSVKMEIGGVACELVLTEIVDSVGDFVFYDAGYVGSGYTMFCVLTDGSEKASEELMATFDERGIECLATDEFLYEAYMKVYPQIVLFKIMYALTMAITVIGVLNVLADQRYARHREFEVMKQSGMTKRGAIALQAAEIGYLLVFALVFGVIFSHALCFIVDTAMISFGMTMYG